MRVVGWGALALGEAVGLRATLALAALGLLLTPLGLLATQVRVIRAIG